MYVQEEVSIKYVKEKLSIAKILDTRDEEESRFNKRSLAAKTRRGKKCRCTEHLSSAIMAIEPAIASKVPIRGVGNFIPVLNRYDS